MYVGAGRNGTLNDLTQCGFIIRNQRMRGCLVLVRLI